jgi:hypothetical protein
MGLLGEPPVQIRARIFKFLFHARDDVNVRNAMAATTINSPIWGIINLGGPDISILLVSRSICAEATEVNQPRDLSRCLLTDLLGYGGRVVTYGPMFRFRLLQNDSPKPFFDTNLTLGE